MSRCPWTSRTARPRLLGRLHTVQQGPQPPVPRKASALPPRPWKDVRLARRCQGYGGTRFVDLAGDPEAGALASNGHAQAFRSQLPQDATPCCAVARVLPGWCTEADPVLFVPQTCAEVGQDGLVLHNIRVLGHCRAPREWKSLMSVAAPAIPACLGLGSPDAEVFLLDNRPGAVLIAEVGP